MEQGSGSVTGRLRRVLSMARRGPAPGSPTEALDDLDGAREAYMDRRDRRAARREHQRAVRRARNRARLRRAGQEIPPELQEPGSEPAPEPEPEPVEDAQDPEIEPRPEPKMQRGPVEDKMLRPHEAGMEDKDQAGPPDDDADDGPGGLDSVEFGSPAARELAESWGLSAEDFEDEEPSGSTGFVKADVERILADYEVMGP